MCRLRKKKKVLVFASICLYSFGLTDTVASIHVYMYVYVGICLVHISYIGMPKDDSDFVIYRKFSLCCMFSDLDLGIGSLFCSSDAEKSLCDKSNVVSRS